MRRNYSGLIRRYTQAFNIGSASYGELTLFHGCITEPSYSIGMHVVMVKVDSNVILVEPMKSQNSKEMKRAYRHLLL